MEERIDAEPMEAYPNKGEGVAFKTGDTVIDKLEAAAASGETLSLDDIAKEDPLVAAWVRNGKPLPEIRTDLKNVSEPPKPLEFIDEE